MVTKSVSSTRAKNNFGRVLEDVTRNQTRYIIERHGVAQAIILGLDDFAHALQNEEDRQYLIGILKELRPEYNLGKVLREGYADDS